MPLYEYYCADCRGKFELLMSYEASGTPMTCTKCHGTNTRKMFSVFARSSRGGDDGGAFGSGDDSGEYGDDGLGGGGCSCGGMCSCGH
jgi:putative FmdB family regulatory protein